MLAAAGTIRRRSHCRAVAGTTNRGRAAGAANRGRAAGAANRGRAVGAVNRGRAAGAAGCRDSNLWRLST